MRPCHRPIACAPQRLWTLVGSPSRRGTSRPGTGGPETSRGGPEAASTKALLWSLRSDQAAGAAGVVVEFSAHLASVGLAEYATAPSAVFSIVYVCVDFDVAVTL